ncbi:MAG: AEC family transporter, partial [Phascolarctobacterium sp.]|nr:AEC family transporter [Phascolarctobacterium sp.]
MDIVLHSLNGILTVMLMMAVGFAMDRRGWFTEDGVSLVSRLVNNVCLPTYMIANLVSSFTQADLFDIGRGVAVPLISMLLGYIAARIMAGYLGIAKGRRGVFTCCVAFSSVIFQGLPLGIAIFGEDAVPYIIVYYMANATLFWTIGMHEIAADAGEEVLWLSRKSLKAILTPPLLGFFAGIILVLIEAKLPEPIFKSCYYIGSMTSPLAMLFIGIGLSRTDWNGIRLDLQLIVAVLGRFFVCPLLVWVLMPFFDVSDMMGNVFIICAAMPGMTNLSILSKAYGGDYKYGAMLVAASTVCSAFVIPFYMWLI